MNRPGQAVAGAAGTILAGVELVKELGEIGAWVVREIRTPSAADAEQQDIASENRSYTKACMKHLVCRVARGLHASDGESDADGAAGDGSS